MPGLLAPPPPIPACSPPLALLGPDDVATLRLPSPRASENMQRALRQRPGRSAWAPQTLEYVQVGRWRNRTEISSIDDVIAVRNFASLLQFSLQHCAAAGDRLLLAMELESSRSPSRYERAGFGLLEEIITYEISTTAAPTVVRHPYQFQSIHPASTREIAQVTSLDQAAFPWLWRNSREEFDAYLASSGVRVSFLLDDGVPVAYIGVTEFQDWGHIDRIAVSPELQGRGYGRAILARGIADLRMRGARHIGLSTQRTNARSQTLYERFGFHRTPSLDYRIFGAWTTPGDPESVAIIAAQEGTEVQHG